MTTLTKFYSDKEEHLQKKIGREVVETFVGQNCVHYPIDHAKTETTYRGETKDDEPRLKAGVTLIGRISIADKDIEFAGKPIIGRGDIIAHIYLDFIAEIRSATTDYEIRRGDIVDFLGETYEIVEAGHGKKEIIYHLGGDRRFYRTFWATKIPEGQFKKR